MKHKLQQERGFTLVEVLIAIVILLIIVISFTTLFTSSYRGITSSGDRSEALFGIQENIERDLKDANAVVVGSESIVFTDGEGVTIPGQHRTFKEVIIDDKEVMIDVFVRTP